MQTSTLNDAALDYWVARSLPDVVREIYFTDGNGTVAIRGNHQGRPWDGRFTPSRSWEAAAIVLERVVRLEVRERSAHGVACVVAFEGTEGGVEGRGESLRLALLRAFVASRFGPAVDDVLQHAQALLGTRAEPVDESAEASSGVDSPAADGRIGDIKSAPR